MRARQVLQNLFNVSGCIAHLKRRNAVMDLVDSLLSNGRLAVTSLGRGLDSHTSEKHRIKRADALLRNRHLQAEVVDTYRALAEHLLSGVKRVTVSVDWSDTGLQEVPFLRAAVSLKGRAFVLYEEVHPRSAYNTHAVHVGFLNTLSKIIPPSTQVIIVTDAGFHPPWFRAVESHGWDWMGRVRGTTQLRLAGKEQWYTTKAIHRRAGRKPRSLGLVSLTKRNPLEADLFLSAKPRPKRSGGRRNAGDYRSSKSHREPWVIACSPRLRLSTRQAMKLYATRMQIEECFRDLKNPRHGLGMRFGRSYTHARVAVLLLIAALATFVLWLAGLVAELQGWTRNYQANTERRRRTLSFVFVGMRVLRNTREQLTRAMIENGLHAMRNLVENRSLEAGI